MRRGRKRKKNRKTKLGPEIKNSQPTHHPLVACNSTNPPQQSTISTGSLCNMATAKFNTRSKLLNSNVNIKIYTRTLQSDYWLFAERNQQHEPGKGISNSFHRKLGLKLEVYRLIGNNRYRPIICCRLSAGR